MAMEDHPFLVDLRGIGDGRYGYTLFAPGSLLDLPADAGTFAGQVRLELDLTLTGRLIAARGTVFARPVLTCARCLAAFKTDLTGRFEVIIRMGPEGLGLEDVEDTPALFGDDWVAFNLSAREALILALPLKPLCREQCRGLCPHCGTNRNDSECNCSVAIPDPRWDALKQLLE